MGTIIGFISGILALMGIYFKIGNSEGKLHPVLFLIGILGLLAVALLELSLIAGVVD